MVYQPIARCLLAVCTVLVIPARGRSGAAGLPQEIRDALLENANEVAPITIEWEYRYLYGTHLVQVDRERYTFTDGKFYLGSTSIQPANLGHSEFCFDGTLFYSGGTDKAILGKSLVRGEPPLSLVDLDYFDDTCLLMPKTPAEMIAGKPIHRILQSLGAGATLIDLEPIQLGGKELLRVRLTVANEYRESAWRTDLRLAERSARKWAKREEDVQCVLSTIQREREMPPQLVDSYYLDPSFHYAMTRWERTYPDGTLLSRCENSDFEQLGSRPVWLPKNCVLSWFWNTHPPVGFALSATPLQTWTNHVISMSDQADRAAQFTLNYTKPGTWILDRSQPNVTKRYQIPTPLENLAVGPRFSLARKLFVAANILLVGWLAGYLLWKQRAKVKLQR